MQAHERIGIVPVPTGAMLAIDDGERRIGMGEDLIRKSHTHPAGANHQVVGLKSL